MANLYDFTFQLTGVKKQKACEEIIKNLKLKKCYVQHQEKILVIKFEESKCEIYKASQIAKKYNCDIIIGKIKEKVISNDTCKQTDDRPARRI